MELRGLVWRLGGVVVGRQGLEDTQTRTMDAGEAYFLPLPCQYFLSGFSFLFSSL